MKIKNPPVIRRQPFRGTPNKNQLNIITNRKEKQMKTKNIKNLIKHSDKKSLRKMCFGLLKVIDDYEIENFCLKEKIEEQKKN